MPHFRNNPWLHILGAGLLYILGFDFLLLAVFSWGWSWLVVVLGAALLLVMAGGGYFVLSAESRSGFAHISRADLKGGLLLGGLVLLWGLSGFGVVEVYARAQPESS